MLVPSTELSENRSVASIPSIRVPNSKNPGSTSRAPPTLWASSVRDHLLETPSLAVECLGPTDRSFACSITSSRLNGQLVPIRLLLGPVLRRHHQGVEQRSPRSRDRFPQRRGT